MSLLPSPARTRNDIPRDRWSPQTPASVIPARHPADHGCARSLRAEANDSTGWHGPCWPPEASMIADAVRYMSVDSRNQPDLQAHDRTTTVCSTTARTGTYAQARGRFRSWWQVLGSNQRRLSRRFYREHPSTAINGLYLRERRPEIGSTAAQPPLSHEPPQPVGGNRTSQDSRSWAGCEMRLDARPAGRTWDMPSGQCPDRVC